MNVDKKCFTCVNYMGIRFNKKRLAVKCVIVCDEKNNLPHYIVGKKYDLKKLWREIVAKKRRSIKYKESL